MKVKLLTTMAGPEMVARAGWEVEVPDDLGQILVDWGYAVQVSRPVESTAVEPPEQAVLPAAKPRKARPRRQSKDGE